MGRIAEEEIERLKQDVRTEHLAEARGVELRSGVTARTWSADVCSMRTESPRWSSRRRRTSFTALDVRRRAFRSIEVMKLEGVSFRQAVEMRAGYPVAVAASERPVKHTTGRKLPPPVELGAEDRELLRQALDYYHARLKQSPEALRTSRSAGSSPPT